MKVLVTASADATLAEVAARLERSGARIEKVLEAVGVIVATVADGELRALAGIEGVGSVEQDREVRLPPPDSGVQ